MSRNYLWESVPYDRERDGLGFIEFPVVGDVPGVAELAGSPVVEPRPLGAPLCAHAKSPAKRGTQISQRLNPPAIGFDRVHWREMLLFGRVHRSAGCHCIL